MNVNSQQPIQNSSGITVPIRVPTEKSRRLNEEARNYSPGGVHGSQRYNAPFPIYVRKMEGARVWDYDDNEYVDFHGCYGPAILGHNEPRVRQAVIDALQNEGVLFGAPHPREVALSKTMTEIIPYAERVGLHGGGGSDSLYNAVRIARAHTGRKKIVKFEGAYHGWHDELAVSVRPGSNLAGPADAPSAVAESAGALSEHAANMLIAPFNDQTAVEKIVDREWKDIAAIVVEPVNHSCGCLLLKPGFLQFLRQICDARGIVLIFDEIITGFRHALEGAGAQQGVHADLAAFGKAMASGFAGSALVGRDKLMSLMEPIGPVLFSGTFNGHLLFVASAQKTIEILRTEPVHEKLFRLGNLLSAGINKAIREAGVRVFCQNYGSVWSLYFTLTEINTYRDIIHLTSGSGTGIDQAYRNYMLNNGVFLPVRKPIRGMISYAHSEDDIYKTIDLTKKFINEHASFLR